MHLIMLRYTWNKNNLSLVKKNKITSELHLAQDLRHQFLAQGMQQTKVTFSKHTLWDKRGETGERHSFCLFVLIQDAQIEKYVGFSARSTPGNVTLHKKRILLHEIPWSSFGHVYQSKSAGPISEGTQWPFALLLITSKGCQVKSYHSEFSHFVFLASIIPCNRD